LPVSQRRDRSGVAEELDQFIDALAPAQVSQGQSAGRTLHIR
jgi:hypothetical protein